MLKQFRASVPFFSQMAYAFWIHLLIEPDREPDREEGHCCSKLFQGTINFVRLLVSVTLEKREGACALFVQKTSNMLTNLPSARKTLLELILSEISLIFRRQLYQVVFSHEH